MSRFYYAARTDNIHFGVVDTRNPSGNEVVLHLYPDPQVSGKVRVKSEPKDGGWQMSPPFSQELDDDGVRANWNAIYKLIEQQSRARNGGELPDYANQWATLEHDYDARGGNHGWNCEELASWVLTGRATAHLGALLDKVGQVIKIPINYARKSSSR